MKTIEINLYKFNELSEEAKQKAIERLSDINVSHNWWECTYEDARTIGLKITGFELDRNRHASGDFILSACEVAQNIFNEHGEECETYKTAKKFMEEWQPIFDEYMNEESEKFESYESEQELQELEDEFLRDLLEDYSIMLQNESEYLMTDEAIIETIEANDYDFTEDGKLY
jgi:hypothetical protein